MAYCTEDIVMTEEAKALVWMDRFIKRYKYEKEAVQTKGDMIKWADGIHAHSICLKDGKFIIDGSEIYITSELWGKYVKMRELTGSILILAPKKIAFPYDWSNLSEEQILENIQYLQKNYKKYKITILDDKHIQIDNVVICRDSEGNIGNGRVYFTINNKKYYRNDNNGRELIDLIHLCKMQTVPFKEKATKWLKQNKNMLIGSSIFIILSNVAYFAGKAEAKQGPTKDVSVFLRGEQQKIVNYNDSINKNIR